ncbi:PTS system, cellobiose-specific IIA component [Weissella hellenica]|uniref:PTS system, cellobiose-specific IIA component n=1 Tax=Weissella hellenica TaxID=46256 RepID=A0ABY0K0K0_WEIHE|nr:PTS lactose/cellobiose transporter subunit IIA [Weissella hellenica]GED35610.1 PTS lactose transporter subunit IIA [Weissella hellenica]SCB79036.1 PTS system, cellobiose-specific IIA component [Weissella hellenica]
MEDDELNQLSMNILVHAGDARSFLVQALTQLEQDDYQKSEELIKKAHEEVVIAHGLQTDTLQLEASGEQIRYSTPFCHAQDTLMTAQSEILIGEHLVKLFKKFIKE